MSEKSTASTDLSHKTILITGAANDIGRALAVYFAGLGARILLLDHDSAGLNAIYDALGQLNPPQGLLEPVIIEFDLAKIDAHPNLLINHNIASEYGHLDALIHTADWTFPLAPLAVYAERHWQQALHNLLYAPYKLTQHLLPVLDSAARARVVFSIAHCLESPPPFYGPYNAAYAALQSLCATWNAEQQAKSTRFCTLNTGKVLTQVRLKHYPAELKHALKPAADAALMQQYLRAIS